MMNTLQMIINNGSKINKLKFNKQEFQNFITIYKFFGNKSSDFEFDGPKQSNVKDKTPTKISK